MPKTTILALREKRADLLRHLSRTGPLIVGSLARVGVRCGNPNCRCARGERHTAYVLTGKSAGRTKTLHVPRDMVEEVGAWVEAHRRLKQQVRQIAALSEQIVRLHVKESRAARATPGPRSRPPRKRT